MKKRLFTFLTLGLSAIALSLLGQFSTSSIVQAQEQEREAALIKQPSGVFDDIPITLVFDVATDARTFRINRGAPLPDAKRGDSFIVEGLIYPAGTLPVGGTLLSPGSFNPDTTPGSIGKWVLRGTFNYDFGEIIGGAEPAVFGTQYFLFNDGRVLVSEGPHAGSHPQLRAITGGCAAYYGASGDVREELIGTNVTGLFNQRFTFKIKRQSLR